jgi:hypothetical protein
VSLDGAGEDRDVSKRALFGLVAGRRAMHDSEGDADVLERPSPPAGTSKSGSGRYRRTPQASRRARSAACSISLASLPARSFAPARVRHGRSEAISPADVRPSGLMSHAVGGRLVERVLC